MGVRLDRYKQSKEKMHKKLYGFLKTMIFLIMFIGLGISLIHVNNSIKDLNYIDNTTLLGINFEDKIFTFLGKSYIIEFDKVLRLFKPD